MILFPYLVVAPAIILILAFKVYPIILSLTQGFIYKGKVSMEGYVRVYGDKNTWKSLYITLKLCIVLIPVQVVIAFFMALLVNLKIKGIGIFRTIYYLPVTISITVACIMWNMILSPNNGVINSILIKLGFEAQPFFTSEKQALWSIMLVCIWKGCGYLMMFILAGLKDIDGALYESAKIDGASYWQSVFSITLPSLKRTMAFVIINATTLDLLLFAPMYQLTQGGPKKSTNTLMYEIYKSAFNYGDRSRSAVLMTLMLAVVGVIVAIQYHFMSKED